MWSMTCWREGEIERDPELRAGRALEELEGWPEEVSNSTIFTRSRTFSFCLSLVVSRLIYASAMHACLADALSYAACALNMDLVRVPLGMCCCSTATERGPEHTPKQDH